MSLIVRDYSTEEVTAKTLAEVTGYSVIGVASDYLNHRQRIGYPYNATEDGKVPVGPSMVGIQEGDIVIFSCGGNDVFLEKNSDVDDIIKKICAVKKIYEEAGAVVIYVIPYKPVDKKMLPLYNAFRRKLPIELVENAINLGDWGNDLRAVDGFIPEPTKAGAIELALLIYNKVHSCWAKMGKGQVYLVGDSILDNSIRFSGDKMGKDDRYVGNCNTGQVLQTMFSGAGDIHLRLIKFIRHTYISSGGVEEIHKSGDDANIWKPFFDSVEQLVEAMLLVKKFDKYMAEDGASHDCFWLLNVSDQVEVAKVCAWLYEHYYSSLPVAALNCIQRVNIVDDFHITLENLPLNHPFGKICDTFEEWEAIVDRDVSDGTMDVEITMDGETVTDLLMKDLSFYSLFVYSGTSNSPTTLRAKLLAVVDGAIKETLTDFADNFVGVKRGERTSQIGEVNAGASSVSYKNDYFVLGLQVSENARASRSGFNNGGHLKDVIIPYISVHPVLRRCGIGAKIVLEVLKLASRMYDCETKCCHGVQIQNLDSEDGLKFGDYLKKYNFHSQKQGHSLNNNIFSSLCLSSGGRVGPCTVAVKDAVAEGYDRLYEASNTDEVALIGHVKFVPGQQHVLVNEYCTFESPPIKLSDEDANAMYELAKEKYNKSERQRKEDAKEYGEYCKNSSFSIDECAENHENKDIEDADCPYYSNHPWYEWNGEEDDGVGKHQRKEAKTVAPNVVDLVSDSEEDEDVSQSSSNGAPRLAKMAEEWGIDVGKYTDEALRAKIQEVKLIYDDLQQLHEAITTEITTDDGKQVIFRGTTHTNHDLCRNHVIRDNTEYIFKLYADGKEKVQIPMDFDVACGMLVQRLDFAATQQIIESKLVEKAKEAKEKALSAVQHKPPIVNDDDNESQYVDASYYDAPKDGSGSSAKKRKGSASCTTAVKRSKTTKSAVTPHTHKLKKVCYGSYNCGIDTPQEIAWIIPAYTTVHGEKYPAIHLCETCEESDVTCPSDCGCLTRDTDSLVEICQIVKGFGLWCDKCVAKDTTEQITTDQLGNRLIEYVPKEATGVHVK